MGKVNRNAASCAPHRRENALFIDIHARQHDNGDSHAAVTNMQWLMKILGYLTGKTAVRCDGCAHLDGGLCYGKVNIPPADQVRPRVCGFFSPRT